MDRAGRAGTAGARRRSPSRGPVRAEAPAKPAVPADFVLLGEFGRAHGLAGEVRLKSHTGDPKAIASYGPLSGSDGRSYVLTHLRQAAGDQTDMLVARVEGVASREGAEALNRTRLHVSRTALGETEEDEFFLTDLVGLAVEGEGGAEGLTGRILSVPDYGGGEMLEIALAGRPRPLLLPFTRAFVPVVDIGARRVVIAPPAGWLEESDERA